MDKKTESGNMPEEKIEEQATESRKDFFADFDEVRETADDVSDVPEEEPSEKRRKKADKDKSGEKPKKKISKGTKVLIIIAGVLVGLALLMALTLLALNFFGGRSLRSDIDGLNLDSTAAQSSDEGTIRYKGKLYRYNKDIITIMLMGVDNHEKQMVSGRYGNANQTDANVLAVLDTKNEKICLISVSRDAICEIDILDSDGIHVGTADAQLALAYSYGDGGDVSCKLTSDAVSRLFYDLPVNAYGSIYLNGVSRLVDVLGGVTVTPTSSFGGFKAGTPVTLKGGLTEDYLRYRTDSLEGNNERMERHKQVIIAMAHAVIEKIKNDPTSILSLYGEVMNNVTTDINTARMVYLAGQAAKMDFDSNIRSVEGESVMGKESHAEYIVDKDALLELIINTFYEPVKD